MITSPTTLISYTEYPSLKPVTIICNAWRSFLTSNFDLYYQDAIKIARKYKNYDLWKLLIEKGLKSVDDYQAAIQAARYSPNLWQPLLAHDKNDIAKQAFVPDEDVTNAIEKPALTSWKELVGKADAAIQKMSTMLKISREEAKKGFYKKAIEVATEGLKQKDYKAFDLWNDLINQQQGLKEAIDIIKNTRAQDSETFSKLLEMLLTHFSRHLDELFTGEKPSDTDCTHAIEVAKIVIEDKESAFIKQASKLLSLLINANKNIDDVLEIINTSKYFDNELLKDLMNNLPKYNPKQAINIAQMCILTGGYGLDKRAVTVWQELIKKGKGIDEAMVTVDTLINGPCPNLSKHDRLADSASLLFELVEKTPENPKIYEQVVRVIYICIDQADGSLAFEYLESHGQLLSESLIKLTQLVKNKNSSITSSAIKLAVVGIKELMTKPIHAVNLWAALFANQNRNEEVLKAAKSLCDEQKDRLNFKVQYHKYKAKERTGVWNWWDSQEWDNFIMNYKNYYPEEFKKSYPNGDPYKIQP